MKREERRLEVVKTSNAINPLVWDDIVCERVSLVFSCYNVMFPLDHMYFLLLFTANYQLGCVGGIILSPLLHQETFRNESCNILRFHFFICSTLIT